MSNYYRALRDDKEVLVVCEQDVDGIDSPLSWTDPVKDHRPLFVLTNHRCYTFGDKDAEDTAWELIKDSSKWNTEWEEEYLYDRDLDEDDEDEDCWVRNPNFIDPNDGIDAIITAADRVDAHVMPVYMYEHSGIWLSLGRDYPFNDRWDSGVLGIILWTQEQQAAWEDAGGEPGDARKVMEVFFGEYSQYVSGEVYCLSVYDPTEELKYLNSKYGDAFTTPITLADLDNDDLELCTRGELLDSCGGFYLNNMYGPIEAATEHFNLTDMEELI